MAYTDFYSTRITPQSQPIPSQEMVKNSAGGGSKNTLEVAGFDAAVPELITTFLK